MVDKLSEELEDARTELSSKNSQLCQAQCRNKCYANQLESLQQEVSNRNLYRSLSNQSLQYNNMSFLNSVRNTEIQLIPCETPLTN